VQPYAHLWSLALPWSGEGSLSYLSLWLAAENLPGYRDYQFLNDDSPYFFENVKPELINASWMATDRSVGYRMFTNMSKQSRDNWQWWGATWSAMDDDEVNGTSRTDNRTESALKWLNISVEEIRWCTTCADAFHVMGGSDYETFKRLALTMGRFAVLLEIAVPSIFILGKLSNVNNVLYNHAQSDITAYEPRMLYIEPYKWVVIHPCKPSQGVCQRVMLQRNRMPVGEPVQIGGIEGGVPW
jgi:hypothetical protein